jgi:hypothetical protein
VITEQPLSLQIDGIGYRAGKSDTPMGFANQWAK